MTSKRTGWFVLTQGAAFITFGALLLLRAESETWATVGLVIGLLGGGGLGTGLSLLLFPDVSPEPIHDEDSPAEYQKYPDPMRTPPAVLPQDPIWFPRCRVHGFDQCAVRTRHCPVGRWNQGD